MLPIVRRDACSRLIVFALFIAVAMLCAHWAGLAHRIHHAQLLGKLEKPQDDSKAHHSCAAFDALTIGDPLHAAAPRIPLPATAYLRVLWTAFISWEAPLSLCFSPRAPPLA